MNSLLEKIIIAKVVSKSKHPEADKLFVINIEIGEAKRNLSPEILNPDGTIQIVTGADNFQVGDLVPFLPPGNLVPGWKIDNDREIILESRKLRGLISHGMILAEDEIGIGEDHDGIFLITNNHPKLKSDVVINDDLIGKCITEVLSDTTFEILNAKSTGKVSSEIQLKIDIINRHLQELIGDEDLKRILSERNLKVYWGTAPTGRPSIGYFLPMIKVSDLLKTGAEVTILLANIHAYLDNMKSSWEVLEYRLEYYQLLIKSILQRLGTPLENLKFITGTDYQLTPDYTLDMYKIATMTTVASVKGAGAEVVKQVDNPVLGGMLYPILQALDEEYLNVDAQLGGIDQRKIFMFAREYLPKLGYKKRIHMLHPLIPGLGKSGKMSSSEPDSKIDFDDTDEVIQEKFNKAFSIDGQVEGNSILAILKYILFYFFDIQGKSFLVERPEKWGGNVSYSSYADLELDFISNKLSSVDLKPAVAREMIELIKPIREVILANSELVQQAYGARS
jgi:tyrosyl-tRNA synthetase